MPQLDTLREQLDWYAGRSLGLPAGISEATVARMLRKERRRHLQRRARMAVSGELWVIQ